MFCVGFLIGVTRGVQSMNEVGDAGACAIGDGLKSNNSLLELHLVSFHGTFYNIQSLLNVSHVVQYSNRIGATGACELAEGLKRNSGLRTIRLVSFVSRNFVLPFGMFFGLMLDAQFSNRIGDVGACAFGDSLKSNRSLKMLWLVSNLLIAAAAACAVLFHLTRKLKGGNVVGDAGACSLRETGSNSTAVCLSCIL